MSCQDNDLDCLIRISLKEYNNHSNKGVDKNLFSDSKKVDSIKKLNDFIQRIFEICYNKLKNLDMLSFQKLINLILSICDIFTNQIKLYHDYSERLFIYDEFLEEILNLSQKFNIQPKLSMKDKFPIDKKYYEHLYLDNEKDFSDDKELKSIEELYELLFDYFIETNGVINQTCKLSKFILTIGNIFPNKIKQYSKYKTILLKYKVSLGMILDNSKKLLECFKNTSQDMMIKHEKSIFYNFNYIYGKYMVFNLTKNSTDAIMFNSLLIKICMIVKESDQNCSELLIAELKNFLSELESKFLCLNPILQNEGITKEEITDFLNDNPSVLSSLTELNLENITDLITNPQKLEKFQQNMRLVSAVKTIADNIINLKNEIKNLDNICKSKTIKFSPMSSRSKSMSPRSKSMSQYFKPMSPSSKLRSQRSKPRSPRSKPIGQFIYMPLQIDSSKKSRTRTIVKLSPFPSLPRLKLKYLAMLQ
jgi:hypothetical protein